MVGSILSGDSFNRNSDQHDDNNEHKRKERNESEELSEHNIIRDSNVDQGSYDNGRRINATISTSDTTDIQDHADISWETTNDHSQQQPSQNSLTGEDGQSSILPNNAVITLNPHDTPLYNIEDSQGNPDNNDSDGSIEVIMEDRASSSDNESLLRALSDQVEEDGDSENASLNDSDINDTANEITESNQVTTNHSVINLTTENVDTMSSSPAEEIRTMSPIDLEDEEQVIEIPADDVNITQNMKNPDEYKAAKDYKCPICFEPPEVALVTPCGHVFCCSCLFQMVNSSRTSRSDGHCALCRHGVKLRDTRLIKMRKLRIRKENT